MRFYWIFQAIFGWCDWSKVSSSHCKKTEKLERNPILLFSQHFVCWWPRTIRCSPQVQKHRSNVWLTKDIPYLALAGELWHVYCECFQEKWPCYIKDVTTSNNPGRWFGKNGWQGSLWNWEVIAVALGLLANEAKKPHRIAPLFSICKWMVWATLAGITGNNILVPICKSSHCYSLKIRASSQYKEIYNGNRYICKMKLLYWDAPKVPIEKIYSYLIFKCVAVTW